MEAAVALPVLHYLFSLGRVMVENNDKKIPDLTTVPGDRSSKRPSPLDPFELSHAEDINQVLFSIANAANTTHDLDELYKTIHHCLGNIIDVTNFFIAIVDNRAKTLYFPYFVDTVDEDFTPIADFDASTSLTGMIVTEKKPILLNKPEELQKRAYQGGVWGPLPLIWMGVPLIIRNEVIGVIAVQSYVDQNMYDENDLQVLSAVSHQTAIAIDRKRAQEEVKKSEKRFRNLFELSNDAIFIHDLDGNILDCNIRATEMMGYSRGQMLRMTFRDFDLRPDHPKLLTALQSIAHLKQHRFETRFKKFDDDVIDVEVSSSDVDSDGEGVVQSVVRDITERKNVEEKLRKSEETFRNIFFNTQVGLFRTNQADGTLIECNEALAIMLGFASREECVEKYSLRDFALDVEDNQSINELLQGGGEVRNHETRMRRMDGSVAWVRYSAKNNEEYDVTEGVVEDITDFRAAYEKTLQLQKKLNRSKKMEALGLLASGVAHDLNNILSGIISYPELMLLKMGEDNEFAEPTKAILKSGKRAAKVVDDLLTLAKSAAIVREIHSIDSLVAEFIASTDFQHLKKLYPQIDFKILLNSSHPNIECSPVHIRKCLMNLVTNGAEAITGGGEVVISTMNQQATQTDNPSDLSDYVTLAVHDTGQGITEDDLEHIYEPFYTRKALKRSRTGLGLAVVWNTMEDHGGEIAVNSTTEGSTFTLRFPASTQDLTTAERPFDLQQNKGRGESILVVDDEPQILDIASQMLRSLGYRVHCVSSGEKALDYLRVKQVDLLLLDMVMDPGINGRQVYEQVVKRYPKQKAIIASGYSRGEDVEACLALGVGAFVKKPYSFEHLSKVTLEVLKSS